jgi:hypothetical protein
MLLGLPKYISLFTPFQLVRVTSCILHLGKDCCPILGGGMGLPLLQSFVGVSHAFVLAFLPEPADERFKRSKRFKE